MRRWLANLIYPEAAHLRPKPRKTTSYIQGHIDGWDKCVDLWNKTSYEEWALKNQKPSKEELNYD